MNNKQLAADLAREIAELLNLPVDHPGIERLAKDIEEEEELDGERWDTGCE